MTDFTKHDARLTFAVLETGNKKNAGWSCAVCGAQSTSHRMTAKVALTQAKRHNGGEYNYQLSGSPA